MSSFISIFITVGICLGIYAYIKKRYTSQIEELQKLISSLNLDLLKQRTSSKDLETQVFVQQKEIANHKTRLEALFSINKELAANSKTARVAKEETKTPVVTEVNAVKKGRKPGSIKPFFKKKPSTGQA